MNLHDAPLTIARLAELEEQIEHFKAEFQRVSKERDVLAEDLRKVLDINTGLSERIRMLSPETCETNKAYEMRIHEAIKTIKAWYLMSKGTGQDWDIYYQHSPEMKRIRGK